MKNFSIHPILRNRKVKKLLMTMKLTVFLLLASLLQVSATVYSQATKFNFKAESKQVVEVLKQIEESSNFRFFYIREQVDVERRVTVKARGATVEQILDELFAAQGIGYKVMDDNLVLLSPDKRIREIESITHQQKAVSGKVTDDTGQPLPGVTVVIKGTTQGTVTNMDGEYSIPNLPENVTLQFSFVGMRSQEIVAGNQTTINVELVVDAIGVDEVVVTAMGIKRQEKALGYSVQKVEGEELQKAKGVYAATALTGKVAGLWVKNSTEFNDSPDITLRGESPLLVIDGVAYSNMKFNDIAADDIESIDVLKGGTASALYGYRGGSGAIIITTKKGSKVKGVKVNINSNNMFSAGFLAFPDVQSSYGHGINGAIADDYVWGPKLDIGNTAMQWNPVTKQMENSPLVSSGKNNFNNFLEAGMVSNTNLSLSQTGEFGSYRVSLNHVYNKGQYPNLKLNKTNFTVSGEMNATDKFTLEGGIGYNRQAAPQTIGQGYGSQGYIYQILLWTGPDYDIRQYRDYWVTKDEKQNWLYDAWYDNPYLMAYERTQGEELSKTNANMTMTYSLSTSLKIVLRNGFDMYSNEYLQRNPININSGRGGFHQKGLYRNQVSTGWSLSSDLLLLYNKELTKNIKLDFLAGGNIYRYTDKNLTGATNNGIVIPGYYSLKNSRDPATVSSSIYQRQVNSTFGKISLAVADTWFFDATGRNDWSSTQSETTRSFFYPSLSTSLVLSEFFDKPSWLNLWKIKGAWTVAKTPLGIYANNQAYSTGQANWNNLLYADFPDVLVGSSVLPNASRTYEFGTSAYFINRLKFDVTYFNKLYYNQQKYAPVSYASGFTSTLINTEEEHVRRGLEISLDFAAVKNENLKYDIGLNWSKSHVYYNQIDPVYSADNLWTKKGERVDTYVGKYWLTDSNGKLAHRTSGLPWQSNYNKLWGYTDPDFVWGISNRLSWKRFDLNINFDGRVGGLMYNYTEDKMWDTGSHPKTDNQWRYNEVVNGKSDFVGSGVKVVSGSVEFNNYGEVISDTRVFAPNDIETSYQSYARNFKGGNMGVVSGTFLKLRDFSVGYNFSPKMAKKIGASNLYVSFTGQNVFLWAKEIKYADPDKGTDSDLTSPSNRYIGVNLNVSF